MWTSSINKQRLLQAFCLVLGICLLASCGKKEAVKKERTVTSKYDESLKDTTGVSASDATHIPPVPGSPEAQAVAPQAIGDYFKAIKLMKEENYEEALEIFVMLEEKFPILSGPIVNQAIIYMKQENFEEAEKAADRAIKTNPQNPYAHNLRGQIMRDKGDFAEARSSYQQALTLDPKYAKAHYNLGVLAELYLQDIVLALNHFRQYQSLQKTPDDTVGNWVKDLENRVERMAPPPAPAPQAAPAATAAEPAPAPQQ